MLIASRRFYRKTLHYDTAFFPPEKVYKIVYVENISWIYFKPKISLLFKLISFS